MLSQQHRSPGGVGAHSSTAAARHHLLAFPPHPHFILLAGVRPALQHHLGILCPPASTSISREYASSCAQFSKSTAKAVGQRRMMHSSCSGASPTSTRLVEYTFAANNSPKATFTFQISPKPDMALSFPPRPPTVRPRKRGRAAADIDGDHSCLFKKKRRLRLFLITSRLSPQYSYPATNIVDRGSSKIAVWAKQKALGRNLLRKAAILNRIRRQAASITETEGGLKRVLVEQEREQKQLELAKLAFVYGSHDTHTRPVHQMGSSFPPTIAIRNSDRFDLTGSPPSRSRSPTPPSTQLSGQDDSDYRSPNDAYSYSPPRAQLPRRSYLPLPPSPLGLSNYDAFDIEDDIPDPYSHLDDEELECYADDTRDDPSSPSASTTVSNAPALAMAHTAPSEVLKTPPQMIYSDFSILEPHEPVVGDFDQVDEGADPIWPNALAIESEEPMRPSSSSPDFPALFATSTEQLASTSPNFPSLKGAVSSPNFPAQSLTSTGEILSVSPNFAPFPVAGKQGELAKELWASKQRPDVLAKRESDIEQERQRQRDLMFMQFGS